MSDETKTTNVESKKATEVKFSKEQLVKSKAYKSYRDLLNALLDDNTSYTKKEVEKAINDYLKRSVN